MGWAYNHRHAGDLECPDGRPHYDRWFVRDIVFSITPLGTTKLEISHVRQYIRNLQQTIEIQPGEMTMAVGQREGLDMTKIMCYAFWWRLPERLHGVHVVFWVPEGEGKMAK